MNDAQVRRFARACGSIGWRADEDMHRGQQARQDARVPQGTCVRTSRRAVFTHVEDHCRSSKCSRASLRTQPKGAPIVPSVAQQCSKVPKVCALLEMVPSHDSKQARCAASTWSFGNVALCIRIPRGLKRILLAFLDTDGGPIADQGAASDSYLARCTQKGPREVALAGSFGGGEGPMR